MLEGVGGKVAQADAGLDTDEQVVHVVFQDLVHVHGAEDNAAVERGAAANQAGAGAAHGYGNLVLVAELHDCGNLLGTVREADGLGHAGAVDGHLVMRIVFAYCFAGMAVVFTDDSLQLVDELGGEFVVLGHVNLPIGSFADAPWGGRNFNKLHRKHAMRLRTSLLASGFPHTVTGGCSHSKEGMPLASGSFLPAHRLLKRERLG